MKQALIYNPYWSTLGGGERYVGGVIQALLKDDYEVTVAWIDQNLPNKLQDRFGLDLKGKLQIDPTIFQTLMGTSLINKWRLEKDYDLIFWVSDGSVPFCFGHKNILHFQVPFKQNKLPFLNLFKFSNITVVCNSQFTKAVIDKSFKLESQVLYPPVKLIPELTKEKVILSVGRFDNLMHHKHQEVLVEAFKKMKRDDWQLVLAGGVTDNQTTLYQLRQLAQDLPIKFVVNPNYETIKKWYGKASIYWHAAGFHEDLINHPERAEHFGISTVEAMSSGAVPIVFNGGGQKEIIKDGINGYLWNNETELTDLSRKLKEAENFRKQMANQAKLDVSKYSEETFDQHLSAFID
jgi:glycosyltransferase involved in cell wall biosynthesis